jgi:DNA-binding transcriptional regulator GbsR (MarR family)
MLQNHIFDKKIREFEEEIVNISLKIGLQRGQNPIITQIMMYLLIHEQLTQKQLKELTDCSIGSISTHLAALNSIGFVEKKLIPGSHTNVYSLTSEFGKNLSSLIQRSTEYILQASQFLENKKNELSTILENKKDHHYKTILDRFEELEYVIRFYVNLFKKATGSNESDFNIELKSTEFTDFLLDYDDDIKKIENEVIEFFTYNPMFFGKGEIFSKTFAFFITRKFLTQKQLHDLTGLSAGKISQEINTLCELGIIEKVSSSETGQITYQMKSVIKAFLNVSFNVLSEYMNMKTKIETINSKLEQQKLVLQKLQGYANILRVVKILLGALPFYEKAYNIISNIRKKLEIS